MTRQAIAERAADSELEADALAPPHLCGEAHPETLFVSCRLDKDHGGTIHNSGLETWAREVPMPELDVVEFFAGISKIGAPAGLEQAISRPRPTGLGRQARLEDRRGI
ncbi:MAG: hypothetical protein O7A04_03420 [Acidobacteria bacterium]|nr:hypothetical protein [Acidobacteriota bacterium]